jgi:flavin reductase (DIM6/NTAB) family NADH-FMN oxidoreductase RutF
MAKVTIGPHTLMYPMPTVLVGADVDGKPAFSTYAFCGIVNARPPMLSVSFRPQRYTYKGVKQTGVFSVNIPSESQVAEADYCGIASGKDADKVADCKFTIFYGKLGNAPLITECPINLECKVLHTLNLGSMDMVVGQIEEIHVTDTCLTNGLPDVAKVKPFLWVSRPTNKYWSFGEIIGEAFVTGKQIKG